MDPPVGIEASLVERGFQTLGERVAFNNEQLKDGGNKEGYGILYDFWEFVDLWMRC